MLYALHGMVAEYATVNDDTEGAIAARLPFVPVHCHSATRSQLPDD